MGRISARTTTLNIEKTNHVVFHSPVIKITETIIIKFGLKHISRSDSVKFLGVLLDESLSWRSHLVEISRKLARSAGIFYKLRHFVLLETLNLSIMLFYPFCQMVLLSGMLLKPVLVSQKKVVGAMTFSDPLTPFITFIF